LPPDFLNSGDEIDYDVILVVFPSLTAFMTQFALLVDSGLSSYTLSTNSFIPANFLQPWWCGDKNVHLLHSLDQMGLGHVWWFNWLCRLHGASHPL
jgi:hypothetical protein